MPLYPTHRTQTLQRLREQASQRAMPVPELREQVRELVVIASSSRGGSSVFAEILRHCGQLLHFRAEINPFLVLSGLGFPESGSDSDALGAEHAARTGPLIALLGRDLGNLAPDLRDPTHLELFLDELHFRLSLQWPGLDLPADRLRAAALALLGDPGSPCSYQLLLARLLRSLRTQGENLPNPWYYDLEPSLVRSVDPELELPSGPPGELILEEPPFVTVLPWSPVEPELLARLPVLVKTPANAYRLPFLRALFPKARLRVLHLTRNAAASINGLHDGWRYRGFFSHNLGERLSIGGYSDLFPAWGRSWWKFDLPPGWTEYTERPLIEVCAFQWRSAHQAILRDLPCADDTLRVRFEDVVGPLPRRRELFARITRWLGIPLYAPLTRVIEEGLPPIMATERPRHRRWYEKGALLEPVLASSPIRRTMELLGYDEDPSTWT